MRVKVLGTRGEIEEFARHHSNHSGVLIDDKLLFDVGEEKFLKYSPDGIFITHLHPDHAFFVTGNNLIASVPIYAPEQNDKANLIIPGGDITMGEYKITPIPTHHSKTVKSFAYLINDGRQRILYTGDLIWINVEYHHLIENLDLVITEGSYIRRGGLVRKDKETGLLYGHNGIPDLVNLFKRFTTHILFTHFGSWFFKDIKAARQSLQQLGKNNGITAYVGYDAMVLDVP